MSGDATPPAAMGSRSGGNWVWNVATQSAPVVIQVVIGVLLVSTWLLSRWSVVNNAADPSRWAVFGATGIAAVASLVVAAVLLRRKSSTARGLGLSAAACAIIAPIGAVPYAFWLL